MNFCTSFDREPSKEEEEEELLMMALAISGIEM
jgi:hypothetical protein